MAQKDTIQQYEYMVAQVDVENLPLTKFRQFWQLMGHYCSYLLPMQNDGASQI